MPGSAPTYNNYNQQTDVVTTQQFMDGVMDATINNNPLLSRLKAKGRIRAGAEGKWTERGFRVGQNTAVNRADLSARTFSQINDRVVLSFPYAWKEITGAIGQQQIMMNTGKAALDVLKDKMLGEMGEDLERFLTEDIFRNNMGSNTVAGYAAGSGSPVPFWGLPTLMGYGSAAQNYDPTTQTTSGAVGATDKEVLPNTTYGGVSTHPTNAIAGITNKQNESTSPVIGNYTSTAWTGTATWVSTCQRVLNHMQDRLTRTSKTADTPDLAFMSRSMFTDLNNSFSSYYRVTLGNDPQDPNSRAAKGNSLQIGSLECMWDNAINANVLWVLNSNHMELLTFPFKKIIMDNGELKVSGAASNFNVETDYSIQQGGYLAVVNTAGQLILDPKYHGMAYAAA